MLKMEALSNTCPLPNTSKTELTSVLLWPKDSDSVGVMTFSCNNSTGAFKLKTGQELLVLPRTLQEI